ncbi:MAG TPA: fatty acid desaturase [Candidatus Binatia bacterium]|jgi:fatty acid desaturase|nr:fatty acid desaturase [Candidatus Binatia bacterium]
MLSEFSASELRWRFANAFQPCPWIYWSDLLASAGVGWAAFGLGVKVPFGSFLYITVTIVAVVALLRTAIFIHELAHLKRGALPGFEIAWHFLAGLPFMLPSLMYVGSHADHHRQATFGTIDDPEYAPLARWSSLRITWFVVSMSLVPVLLACRWGILGPLSYFIHPLRRLVVERASTLVINPNYRRPLPSGQQVVRWRIQETSAALTCWITIACGIVGWIPLRWFFQWYVVAIGVVLVNQLRTLAAHRYDNDGTPLDSIGQLLDSVTLSGWPVPTVLAAPVGLRYHALHHFLPTVPYHSLGTLHRQLLAELPADSPYRRTQRSGILTTVRDLLGRQESRDTKIRSAARAAGKA